MELHLLGTVQATLDGRPIPLGATKQRAVLVMLALQANATVSVDRLVDGLWGELPPATAPKMVQLYVSQLRRLLAGDGAEIVTHGRGYELRLSPEAIDASRFERLVDEAARSPEAPNGAARDALALWHGAALADVAGEPFAAAEIRRLEELWLRASELAVEGDLAAGRNDEALAQLERLIAEHPLRERLHAQRMLALYRSGRQAEALEAYAAARRRLVDDVGVEPSAELRELQERILRQDPSLRQEPAPAEAKPAEQMPPATRAPPARPTARRRLLLAAGAAALVAIAVFAITRLTGPDALSGLGEDAVGVIDPGAAAITAQYRIGSDPGAVAVGAGSVWVASPRGGTVSRIHRETDRLETIDAGADPTALAFGGGSLWVGGGDDGAVTQVDPGANRVVQRIPVGNGLRALAVGHGALWAATALDGEVVRIDLRSGRVTRRVAVGGQPAALATGAGSVWAAGEESGTVTRIDPRSGDVIAGIAVGNGPAAVAVGLGAVWVANRQDGTVSRIDPATDHVTETVPTGGAPVALTIADHAMWVADAGGAVLRLDPGTRTITDTVRTGSTPAGLAAVDGSIWVTAVAPPAAHRGGTLRVGGAFDMDPASGGLDVSGIAALQLAYEGLVDYRRAGGAAGARLVGDLAADVPKPTDGGRRYVFRLRRGLRYSDGTPVRAVDVRSSMERAWAVRGDSGVPFPDAIEGAARCRKAPRSCDLSRGIVVDERAATVTIRLSRRDPEPPQKLASPMLSVVPSATPRRPLAGRPPPGTGPYRVDSVVPGRRVVLTRNRYFGARGPDGRRQGLVDRVEMTTGGEREQIAAVERGRLDLASVFEATAPQLAALRTRLGTRVRSAPAAFTEYAWLNVKAAPFDDLRVRRALNLAVNRARVVSLTGGPDAGSPACQLLPPGLPGYRPICPYTVVPSPAGTWTAPDRAEARRLVAASGARGTPVEVWGWAPRRDVARHLVTVLRELGFRSRLRVFGDLGKIEDADVNGRQRPQIGVDGWIADYPEPAAFLNSLISCNGFTADRGIPNLSRFCDPSIDSAIGRARAAGPDAGAAWQRIERRVAERAPVVPLTTRRSVVVTSKRLGNVQFRPGIDVLLDQLWVR